MTWLRSFWNRKSSTPCLRRHSARARRIRPTVEVLEDRRVLSAADGLLIFESDRDGGYRHIFRMDPDGSNVTQLTFGPYNDAIPEASEDGSKIVFASDRNHPGFTDLDIFMIDWDGSNMTFIAGGAGQQYDPSISPNNRYITFQTGGVGGVSDLYMVDLQTQTTQNLTNDALNETFAAWGGDGRSLIYTTNVNGSDEIFLMTFDANMTVKAREQLTFDGATRDFYPDINYHNTQIAWTKTDATNAEIYLADLVADSNGNHSLTNIRNLTNTPATSESVPYFSPDDSDKISFFSNRDIPNPPAGTSASEIYTMVLETGVITRLTNDTFRDIYPTWVEDPAAPDPDLVNVTSATSAGLHNVGAVVSIDVTFSEAVTVSGTPTLVLNSGPGVTAVYTGGSATATLTFSYTVAPGQWTPGTTNLDYTSTTALVLTSGSSIVYSSSGLNADLTLPTPGGPGALAFNEDIRVDTRTSTVGIYHPGAAQWFFRDNNTPGAPTTAVFAYGFGSHPVVGDWNGDGQASVGIYHPGSAQWFLKNSNSAGAPDIPVFAYGFGGVIPLVGDWDGDGDATVGVYDPSTAIWYLTNNNAAGPPSITPFAYGFAGAIPVVGDWDGDGDDNIGVYFPATAQWFLRDVNGPGAPTVPVFAYGFGSKPVVGDWNGDGQDTIGVWDINTARWYLRDVNGPGAPSVPVFAYGFGAHPIVGDWNFPAAPLQASTQGSGAADLTAAQLQSTVDAALKLLGQAGLDSGTLARLGATQFELGHLAGCYLGLAFLADNRVVIDADATGHGWFVDGTPYLGEEFAGGVALPGSAAAGRMDLLSTVLHELGHQAGLEHSDDLMNPVLSVGTRPNDVLTGPSSSTKPPAFQWH